MDKERQRNMSRAPYCLDCVYFSLTYDLHFPRSCSIFAIKSQNLPSIEVFHMTGIHCPAFKLRQRPEPPASGEA
jgi:hypothetical protein